MCTAEALEQFFAGRSTPDIVRIVSPALSRGIWRIRGKFDHNIATLLDEWKTCVRNVLGADVTAKIKPENVEKSIKIELQDTLLLYYPLALHITEEHEKKQDRIIVGIGGAAGAGKTVFSWILRAFINYFLPESCCCEILGLDAYHFTNEKLTEQGLRHLKGRPETFDQKSASIDLSKLRLSTEGSHSMPIYDRQLHDPKQNAVEMGPNCKIILIEGLFVLNTEDGWDAVSSQLDIKIHLDISLDLSRLRATERKSRGNKITEAKALEHFRQVDEPNYAYIAKSAIAHTNVIRINQQ